MVVVVVVDGWAPFFFTFFPEYIENIIDYVW